MDTSHVAPPAPLPLKVIRDRADLAINGAPPAFAEPLHVGRPNIGDRETILAAFGRILDSHWLTNNGPVVQEFERRVANYLGVRHCVAMCNGTIALEIAIRALGFEGEVIVPSWTFVATAHALHWQGITPVFADIDPTTHNLDPEAVRQMITPRTTGIIGVHLWGRAAPVEALQSIADDHDLGLMFDAAHAFGSTHGGRRIGGFGACEVFSFHATKAFNTMEGGAVTTNDDALAGKLRLMRNFGFQGYDNVIHPGTNGKMIEACAAVGLANLETLETVFAKNRTNHASYRNALAGVPGVKVLPYPEDEKSSRQYVVLELDARYGCARDQLVAALQAENVLARKYFWPGCHRMQPYASLFPDAERLLEETAQVAEKVVILPTGTSIARQSIETIASVIRTLAGTAA